MFTGIFIDSFVVSPYLEQSRTEFVFDVASGPSPMYSPNILSELTYTGIKSQGYGLQLAGLRKVSSDLAFYYELAHTDTGIKSGNVQDSDYSGDNRTGEFSRSYASVEDNGTNSTSYLLGAKTRWFGTHGHYITVFLGHDLTDMNLTATNGIQAIPYEASGVVLTGLNTEYNAKFSSQFYGFGTEHVFKWGTIGLLYDIRISDYRAKGNWNLRDDLAHPTSFADSGSGKGKRLKLDYSYPLDQSWDVFLNWLKVENEVHNGFNQVFLATGESSVTTLNNVSLESTAYQFGVRYIF